MTSHTLQFIAHTLSVILALFAVACDPQSTQQERGDATVISPPLQPVQDFGITEEVDLDLPGPLLNSILPTRSPLSGGVRVRVIGDGFRAPMFVRVGGESCQELEVESGAQISCVVPPADLPQKVDVEVGWLDPSFDRPLEEATYADVTGALRVLPEIFTYFQPLEVSSLSPVVGPASGSAEVLIEGQGFIEPLEVRFGGLQARSIIVESPELARVTTPEHEPGIVDVQVRTPFNSVTLTDAYNFRVPIGIDQILPTWSPLSGGIEVTVYGYGLIEGTTLSVSERVVDPVELTQPSRVRGSLPPARTPGWAPLSVSNSNGEYEVERAILYLPEDEGPFTLYGVIPEQLPFDRGGEVLIGGNGFNDQVQVSLDGERVGCRVQSPQRLTCFLPAHPLGVANLTVSKSLLSQTLPIRFVNQLEVYQLVPDHAAISGGALIRATGRGFTELTRFIFGEIEVEIDQVISSEEVILRAPPHPPATLDITALSEDQSVFIPQLFTYFDPLSQYGGSWGEIIEGSLNITVLNIYDFSPVPEVTVEVRPFDQPTAPPLVTGLTNDNGQVTLSSLDLTPPLHVNLAKIDFEAQTVERVVSENYTALLFPFVPPEGEGEPPPPPDPVSLRGVLTGLNDIVKPSEPGYTLRAFVDVSHRSKLGRASNPQPSPLGILSEDGPFEISTRPGQFAIVATAAYVPDEVFDSFERGEVSYWFMREQTKPIKIGLVRFLSLSPGATLDGLMVALNHELDERAEVTLLNPPSAAGEVYTDGFGEISIVGNDFKVRAFLDLGPDGYWELDIGATSPLTDLNILGLPDLETWSDRPTLSWYAQAKVFPQRINSFALKDQSDLSRPVELGPFAEAPRFEAPGLGGTFRVGDRLRWTTWPGVTGQGTEPAQATSIRFYQAGLPLWSFVLPGGVRELVIPPLPFEQVGVGSGSVIVVFETTVSDPPLEYQDYTLLDFNSATSYSTSQFEMFFERE